MWQWSKRTAPVLRKMCHLAKEEGNLSIEISPIKSTSPQPFQWQPLLIYNTKLSTEFSWPCLLSIAKLESAVLPNHWWMLNTHRHTHTMKYYSSIKKYEIMSGARKWMKLESINVEQDKASSKGQIPPVLSFLYGTYI
jgi:hypothetical protein